MLKTYKLVEATDVQNAKDLLGSYRYFHNNLVVSANRPMDAATIPSWVDDTFEYSDRTINKDEAFDLYQKFNAIKQATESIPDMSLVGRKQTHGCELLHKHKWVVKNDTLSFNTFSISPRISKHSKVANIKLYYNRGAYYIAIETIKNKRPQKPLKEKRVNSKCADNSNEAKSGSKSISDNILCIGSIRVVSEKQARAKYLIRKINRSVDGSKRNLAMSYKLLDLKQEALTVQIRQTKANPSFNQIAHNQYLRVEKRSKRASAYMMLSFDERYNKMLAKTKRHQFAAARANCIHKLETLSERISNEISLRKDQRFAAEIENRTHKVVNKGSVSLAEFMDYLKIVRNRRRRAQGLC